MKFLILLLFAALGACQRRPPNYPFDQMPRTTFSCRDKIIGGYYADPETDCQMFHVCVKIPGRGVQDFRFLCPNDTSFDQENQICDDWYNIDCEASTLYYSDNFDLYRLGGDIAKIGAIGKVSSYSVNNAVSEPEDDLYLQKADRGDSVSNDLLRGSHSSNFFTNKNRGREYDDDVKEYSGKSDKKQVRKLLTGRKPVEGTSVTPVPVQVTEKSAYYKENQLRNRNSNFNRHQYRTSQATTPQQILSTEVVTTPRPRGGNFAQRNFYRKPQQPTPQQPLPQQPTPQQPAQSPVLPHQPQFPHQPQPNYNFQSIKQSVPAQTVKPFTSFATTARPQSHYPVTTVRAAGPTEYNPQKYTQNTPAQNYNQQYTSVQYTQNPQQFTQTNQQFNQYSTAQYSTTTKPFHGQFVSSTQAPQTYVSTTQKPFQFVSSTQKPYNPNTFTSPAHYTQTPAVHQTYYTQTQKVWQTTYPPQNLNQQLSNQDYRPQNTAAPQTNQNFRPANTVAPQPNQNFRPNNVVPQNNQSFRPNSVTPQQNQNFRQNTPAPQQNQNVRQNTVAPQQNQNVRQNTVAPQQNQNVRQNTGAPQQNQNFRPNNVPTQPNQNFRSNNVPQPNQNFVASSVAPQNQNFRTTNNAAVPQNNYQQFQNFQPSQSNNPGFVPDVPKTSVTTQRPVTYSGNYVPRTSSAKPYVDSQAYRDRNDEDEFLKTAHSQNLGASRFEKARGYNTTVGASYNFVPSDQKLTRPVAKQTQPTTYQPPTTAAPTPSTTSDYDYAYYDSNSPSEYDNLDLDFRKTTPKKN